MARRLATLLLSLCCAALVAGACGDGTDDDGDGAASGGGDDAGQADGGGDRAAGDAGGGFQADLEYVVEGVAGKEQPVVPAPAGARCTRSIPATCTGTVSCPPGGDAGDAAQDRCAWLEESADTIFAEPPADQVCTEIYGGAATARVEGVVAGEVVSADFARTNGCEISRWEAAAPLWDDEALASVA